MFNLDRLFYPLYEAICEYLVSHQNVDGSFSGCTCPYHDRKRVEKDDFGKTGISTYILWNLSGIDADRISAVKRNLENYLLAAVQKKGNVTGWSWADNLKPDFDDTVINYHYFNKKNIVIPISIDAFMDANQCNVWTTGGEKKRDDIVQVNSLLYFSNHDWNRCVSISDEAIEKILLGEVFSDYYVYPRYALLYHFVMNDGIKYSSESKIIKLTEWIRNELDMTIDNPIVMLYLCYSAVELISTRMREKCKTLVVNSIKKLVEFDIGVPDTFFFKGPADVDSSNQWLFGGTCLYYSYILNLLDKAIKLR